MLTTIVLSIWVLFFALLAYFERRDYKNMLAINQKLYKENIKYVEGIQDYIIHKKLLERKVTRRDEIIKTLKKLIKNKKR